MALALGKTVSEIENEMSMREFNEWETYHRNSLFPMDRQEIQMAQLLMRISSYMGEKPKSEDFLVRARNKATKVKNDLTNKVKSIFEGLV